MSHSSRAVVRAACLSVLAFQAAKVVASPPVAPTDWLSPADEKAKFKLPPGFEVQLVAAEPDIQKPMNIAFDSRGRLWVTDTVEYPWPVKEGEKGRDTVKILEDFDENGKARKITTFVDGLNIPLGVLPLDTAKGTEALVYGIPEVRKWMDTDNDGKADQSDPLLRGFASVDTHGMTNNFVQGFDGWIYANHGFKNDSDVKAADGSAAKMQSGHTYRFLPNGTKLEIFARGQVNPFGLCFDPFGNLYSADCHSKPQYMLLRGAYYPSFGKPDDGLGFGPEMCSHDHGSTAIAGTMYYAAEQFPAEFRGNLFDGNVATNAINRDEIIWHGSSPKAVAKPDFMTSDDPWFRPVQIKLGPDGAMWVADFYNKIIGHYEVDLKHPGRDRTSGRIWRIVYKGDAPKAPAPVMPDVTRAESAVVLLGDSNLTVRLHATNWLAATSGPAEQAALEAAIRKPTNWMQRVHAMWALRRSGGLTPELLELSAKDSVSAVRVHVMRLLAEEASWTDAQAKLALAGLADDNAMVRRAAADATSRHPALPFLQPLLDAKAIATADDVQLLHTLKISMRNVLAIPGVLSSDFLPLPHVCESDWQTVVDLIPAIPGSEAGLCAKSIFAGSEKDRGVLIRLFRHAALNLPEDTVAPRLAMNAQERFRDDLDMQLELLKTLREAMARRGVAPEERFTLWATDVVTNSLKEVEKRPGVTGAWSNHSVKGLAPSADPWAYQTRKCADNQSAELLSSHPRGEQLTGRLQSQPFDVPPQLSFYLCGHNGFPTGKPPIKNLIRLRAAGTNEVLMETSPPRNDVAQKVMWDLKAHAGKKGYIEVIDGDTADAYAWIAFGRLDPPVVPMPSGASRDSGKNLEAAAEIAGWLKLAELSPALGRIATAANTPAGARTAAAKALIQIDSAAGIRTLAAPLEDATAAAVVREAAAAALAPLDSAEARDALVNALKTAPQKLQQSIAVALAGTKPGATALFDAVGQGKASPRLLLDKSVRDRLNQSKPNDFVNRVTQLTKGMPSADEAIQKLINEHVAAFSSGKGDAMKGREVFAKNCAACHKLGNEGAQVGPQLDGVGKRGVERLMEDILDPSRNVDAAFRYSVLTIDNGDVLTGLQRREEGQTLVFADGQGKEFSLPKNQITKRTESQLSLMPGNFGQTMTPEELNHLLAFLMK